MAYDDDDDYDDLDIDRATPPECPLTRNTGRRAGYYLAFYELDRAYGGPEEGGWWYDTETLVRVVRIYRSQEAAERAERRANRLLRHLARKHRHGIGSVLYAGGIYAASVSVGVPPRFLPEHRPTYC